MRMNEELFAVLKEIDATGLYNYYENKTNVSFLQTEGYIKRKGHETDDQERFEYMLLDKGVVAVRFKTCEDYIESIGKPEKDRLRVFWMWSTIILALTSLAQLMVSIARDC